MTADQRAFTGFLCLVTFLIGGAVGALPMKWATEAELRSLREQLRERTGDANKCCNVAYVLQKYRHEDCQKGPTK